MPIISGIIENTKKKALESSLWAIDSSTKNYYSKLVLKDNTEFEGRITFEINNNICSRTDIENPESNDCLDFESDNIRIGYVSIYSNNSASICIDDGKYYANKSASSTIVEVGEGRCTSEYSDETKKYLETTEVTSSDIDDLQRQINDLKDIKKQFLNAHPIGSIYITIASDEASVDAMKLKYPGSNWRPYGEGRTIISAGTGTDSNSESKTFSIINNVPDVGGEYNHQLSVEEMPSHAHSVYLLLSGGSGSINYSWGTCSIKADSYDWHNSNSSWNGNQNYHWGSTTSVGNTVAHNNLQPYIVAYMYERIPEV